MSIESYYKQTATFATFDGTLDAYRAPNKIAAKWDAIASNVPCMLQPKIGREKFTEGKEYAWRTHILFCAVQSGLNEADRVTVDSKIYNIVGFKDPNSLDHHMEIDLKLVV